MGKHVYAANIQQAGKNPAVGKRTRAKHDRVLWADQEQLRKVVPVWSVSTAAKGNRPLRFLSLYGGVGGTARWAASHHFDTCLIDLADNANNDLGQATPLRTLNYLLVLAM